MKYAFYFSLLIIIFTIVAFSRLDAQKFGIPPDIKKELHKKEFKFKDTTYYYYAVYPKDYDSTKKYPVFLALSGGMANDLIVDVCYVSCFRSSYFDNYITILPIAPQERPLEGLNQDEIKGIINEVIHREAVKSNDWLLAGTSYGGNAAFNFAKVQPKIFSGIIVMPGKLNFDSIPGEWKKYKVMLAVGENDSDYWKADIERTAESLQGKVKEIIRFTIKGQGNIIRPAYKIDNLYKEYFKD